MSPNTAKLLRYTSVSLWLYFSAATAGAGLFEDEDARKAILELRQSVETLRQESAQKSNRATEENVALRRSLLELQNQQESLRAEMATLRGLNEQVSRDLSEAQRRQKDVIAGVDDRLRQFEPLKVTVDGKEFNAEPAEKRDYEAALAVFRSGDFSAAQSVFVTFLKRYTHSGYAPSALFWLGNAQYATRNYNEAMANFRTLIAKDATHARAAEALLSVANCQTELKDTRGARKTLDELIKNYPQSEAALAAKERQLRLK